MSDPGSGGAQGAGAAIISAVGNAGGTGANAFVISATPARRQVQTVALSRIATVRRIGQTA